MCTSSIIKFVTSAAKYIFGLHAAVVLIVAGMLVTSFTAQHGKILLEISEPKNVFELKGKGEIFAQLPFSVELRAFDVIFYPGTQAPQDYESQLCFIEPDGSVTAAKVSMNQVARYQNYRFYQSGYDREGRVSLMVAHDPWGIALTYTGYALLLLSMSAAFFYKRSRFRQLLKKLPLGKGTPLIFLLLIVGLPLLTAAKANAPQTLPDSSVAKVGQLYLLYNDRVCPLQTLARDFTIALYGVPTYKGLSSEQVLCGWLFYPDHWRNEPLAKAKGADARHDLMTLVCGGQLLKIFPVSDSLNGVYWCAPGTELPPFVDAGEQTFVRHYLTYARELIRLQQYDEFNKLMDKTLIYQRKNAGELLPGKFRTVTERLYLRIMPSRVVAILSLLLGMIACGYALYCVGSRRPVGGRARGVGTLLLTMATLYLLLLFAMRWIVAGYIPLSNGYETMLFLALCAAGLAWGLSRRQVLAVPFGLLLVGFSLLVAMMGSGNLAITRLQPVLSSPLLSVHVTVIMLAYALLAFGMLNGLSAIGLAAYWRVRGQARRSDILCRMQEMSLLLLYPAVFLLTAGIIIGSVWANVSWGTYWSWDPKETWALITLIVYLIPLHESRLPSLHRTPIRFHLYMVVAFLSVLFTYFGVNLLFGGMHSYA